MRPRRAASALEVAFILPVVLLLLAGIMDWSWLLFHQMSVVVASGRGARIAAGVSESDDPEGAAARSVETWLGRFGLDPDRATIQAQVDSASDPQTILVEVSVPYHPLVGLLPMPNQAAATAEGVYYGHLY